MAKNIFIAHMKIRCKNVVGKIILCSLLPVLSFAQLKRYQLTQPKMGSPFIITVYDHDSAFACSKMKEAFQLVDSINALFSDYDSLALAYKLSDAKANEWITVPAEMMQILVRSKKAHQLSFGTFDISMGALSRRGTHTWRRLSSRERSRPGPAHSRQWISYSRSRGAVA